MTDLNPQAAQMADESMVRNLAAQANAIWPQEAPLFARYDLPVTPKILDAGCGTGEGASRLARLFPEATVLGIDIVDPHLDLARSRYADLAPRLSFAHQSIFELPAADHTYDLVTCRHVIHSIPFPDRVVAELARVTRRGGYLHLIPEDYGMLHFQRAALDVRDFWHAVPAEMSVATNTDLFVGRNMYGILASAGLEQIKVDYAVVDTARVDHRGLARRLRQHHRRHDVGLARESGSILQSDDPEYPRPTRLRRLVRSDRQRARSFCLTLRDSHYHLPLASRRGLPYNSASKRQICFVRSYAAPPVSLFAHLRSTLSSARKRHRASALARPPLRRGSKISRRNWPHSPPTIAHR
jgi:SAM-dependent methyltransferase